MVVSDYFGDQPTGGLPPPGRDKAEAARLTLDAGMDSRLPSIDCFRQPLLDAVARATSRSARIDESVRAHAWPTSSPSASSRTRSCEPEGVAAVLDAPAAPRPGAHDGRAVAGPAQERRYPAARATSGKIASPSSAPTPTRMRNYVGDYAYPAHIETLDSEQADDRLRRHAHARSHEVAWTTSPPSSRCCRGCAPRWPETRSVTYAQGCGVLDPATSGIAGGRGRAAAAATSPCSSWVTRRA